MQRARPAETKQAARPRDVRGRRRRWLRRWAKGLGGLGLAAGLLTAWGWRYGFTRLPSPAPGITLPDQPAPRWTDLSPDSVWTGIRRLAEHPDLSAWRDELDAFNQPIIGWIQTGRLSPAVAADLADWLARNPVLADELSRVVRLRSEVWPADLSPAAPVACRCLWQTALVRAAVACPEVAQATPAQAVEALRGLSAGYALLARLTPTPPSVGLFDERGPAEIEATLGAAFRRLATEGPRLPAGDAQALDSELAALPERCVPFPAAYRRQSGRARRIALLYRRLPWSQVWTGLAAKRALLAVEWRDLQTHLWRWFGGGDLDLATSLQQVGRTLSGATSLIAYWAQTKLARDADFDRLWEAAETRAVAAALEGGSPQDLEDLGPPFRRAAWQRAFDRPPVWDSLEILPLPDRLLASQDALSSSLERARAALRRGASRPTAPSASAGATATPP